VLFKVKSVTPEAKQLTAIVSRCGAQIESASEASRTSKPDGLHHRDQRLENEADVISAGRADLFDGTHDLLDVMRWRELYGGSRRGRQVRGRRQHDRGIVLRNR